MPVWLCPTCGLALSESERVFTGLLDSVDVILEELGLRDDPILVRMTGCPNGCARPYNADFAFVGRAPGQIRNVCWRFKFRGQAGRTRKRKSCSSTISPVKSAVTWPTFTSNDRGARHSANTGAGHDQQPAQPTPEQFHLGGS